MDSIDEILVKLVPCYNGPDTIEQLLCKDCKELLGKAKQQLETLFEKIANEVIGSPNGYVATDDLITDHKVSFAIQDRVKNGQYNRLNKLMKG